MIATIEQTWQVLFVLRWAISGGDVQNIMESLPGEYTELFNRNYLIRRGHKQAYHCVLQIETAYSQYYTHKSIFIVYPQDKNNSIHTP